MEYFHNLFEQWGYYIVFFGSLIEGESIIIPACIAAYFGHLNIFKIMIIAFIGTLIADQSLFYLGRFYGPNFVKRFPRFQKPAEKAFKLLHKWDYKFILSMRFIYGIRIISPIVIGSSGFPPYRFVPVNIFAAFLWAITSGTIGYFLGSVIDVIGYAVVEKYLLLFSVSLLGTVLTLGYFAWKKLHPDSGEGNDTKPSDK
jgi:membrane protein DedA with SNARE-associated domain